MVIPRSFRKGMIKVGIAYPSNSRVALQSLSIHVLRRVVDGYGGTYTDFIFMEDPHGEPRGLHTGMRLRDFDIVLFSVHYELDYPNIVRMLINGGLKPLSSERGLGDPVIVVGGPTVMANPEPLAPFVDVVTIGDAEVLVPRVLRAYEDYGRDFSEYASVKGLYVPSLGKYRVEKAFAVDLMESVRLIHDTALSLRHAGIEPVFGHSGILEVMRGCGRGCLFCMEGYVMKPLRYADIEGIKDVVRRDVASKVIDRVVLMGLSVGDHPGFRELMKFLVNEMGLSVSVPSLRVDSLDEEVMELMVKGGQKVLTIAPETSERLRALLGKGFTNEDVVKVVRSAVKLGFDHVKLYLMVGLPGEGPGDIKDIKDLLGSIKSLGARVHVSLNPWIPKPHTPLQWLPMDRLEPLQSKMREIRDSKLYDEYFEYNPVDATVQALFSLGDRDVGDVILSVALSGVGRGVWRRLMRRYGELFEKYVYSHKDLNKPLPWSHIIIPGAEEERLRALLSAFLSKINTH
ncbi:radical SAM protein [Vulcanisaeta thermophila]|uniref:radical SAM protein n=1 Tax=Vulcanisaeta thermophila TaxID=867917 RepID=UPI000A55D5AA|nr:radical SAM protein [Vulcanisaeta thermophila]